MVKPTIIGSRVDGQAAVGALRPTVLHAPTQAAADLPTPTPSTIPATRRSTQAIPAAAPADTPPQTIVPGTVRQGHKVSPVQLQSIFPAETPQRLQAVQQLLSHTVVETLTPTDCAQWGVSLQSSYSQLMDQSVQLSRTPTLQRSERHFKRLLDLLQHISTTADTPKDNSPWFWRKNKSALELVHEHTPELSHLSQLLQQAWPALNALAAQWDSLVHEVTPLQDALATHSLAAQYLAEHLDRQVPHDPRSAILQRQSATLLQTQAHIQHSAPLRSAQSEHFRALAHHIQHTVLMGLPSWLDQVHLLERTGTPHASQSYTLWQDLQQLLQPQTHRAH